MECITLILKYSIHLSPFTFGEEILITALLVKETFEYFLKSVHDIQVCVA